MTPSISVVVECNRVVIKSKHASKFDLPHKEGII